MIVMIVMIITMMMLLILTKVSGPDPECLEVTELLHAGAGRGAGARVRHLQAQLAALEAATCTPADYSCCSCYSAAIVTLSPCESARELPQLAPVRVGVAVRAADRAPAALLGPALAAADRQLQLLQAVVHRVQLLSALPGPRP